jgi:hypothetical protein
MIGGSKSVAATNTATKEEIRTAPAAQSLAIFANSWYVCLTVKSTTDSIAVFNNSNAKTKPQVIPITAISTPFKCKKMLKPIAKVQTAT